MKTSPSPHWICIVAMCTDIIAVVQARSRLSPTTWSGKPARNGMAVPGCACSPIISTAPRITPSHVAGVDAGAPEQLVQHQHREVVGADLPEDAALRIGPSERGTDISNQDRVAQLAHRGRAA